MKSSLNSARLRRTQRARPDWWACSSIRGMNSARQLDQMLRRADMRRLAVAITLAVLLGGAVLAQTCDDETIDAVATDGSVIKMRSGARFHVNSSDRIDASLWSPLDDVLIC